jgi:hypothetical protein
MRDLDGDKGRQRERGWREGKRGREGQGGGTERASESATSRCESCTLFARKDKEAAVHLVEVAGPHITLRNTARQADDSRERWCGGREGRRGKEGGRVDDRASHSAVWGPSGVYMCFFLVACLEWNNGAADTLAEFDGWHISLSETRDVAGQGLRML